MFNEIRSWFGIKSISTKITLICSVFFIALIAMTNFVMWLSISYALYHPAEATIEHSIENARKILEESDKYPDALIFHSIHKILVSGVVLRVYDEKGNLLFDTDEINYPTNEMFEKNIIQDPPILADETLKMAKINNAIIYRADISFYKSGQYLIFYFYRTITSQKNIFDDLGIFMIIVDLLSVVAAIRISRFISHKVLLPIKNITRLAEKISTENESERVKERIPVPPANDEISELAKTFNEMLDRMQGDISEHKKFVSDASHELRKPLTIIEGYVEVLEKFGKTDIKLRDESLEAIRDETQNIQTLLKNLRPSPINLKKELKFHKKVFELSEVVETAFQRENTTFHNHEMHLIQNDSAQIYGDKTAILQLIRIFLDNAIKYTPEGGKVQLNSVIRDDKILVSIIDTGIGIAKENFDKIFQRGVRLIEDNFVKQAEGSGIGLSIAKEIADAHSIKINIVSTLGEGTTFTLSIPLAK
ncbi:MAG: HAMP domain-containing histidine kinase [Selenomonadaceae bacterium]|nr:HAMP domain-containing histidine kinase [Selenomonadaceae bacterium]